MHPLPRALLLSLVWLMVALLPMRGWAQVQMGLAQAGSATTTTTAAAHGPADGPAGPAAMAAGHCEAMLATAWSAAAEEAAASSQHAAGHSNPADHTSHAGCTLCVLCHAGLAASPELQWMLPAPQPAGVLPGATPRGIPDGATSELFRPPRNST